MLLYNSTSRQAKIVAHCSNRDWYSCSGVWYNHYHWEHVFFLQEVCYVSFSKMYISAFNSTLVINCSVLFVHL